MTYRSMVTSLTVLAGALVAVGCGDLAVPDYNNPSLEDLQTSPTPIKIAGAAQGLLVGTRAGIGAPNGYISLLGILGRESYNFDAADPRFVTEMLEGALNGGSPAFGGNLWAAPYGNIRNANTLLAAVDDVVGLSDAEKDGVRGFARTIQALDFLNVINTRDTYGAAIAVDGDPTGDPAPIVTRAEVLAHIVTLLDDGDDDLSTAGSEFAFALSSGFEGVRYPRRLPAVQPGAPGPRGRVSGRLQRCALGAGGVLCVHRGAAGVGGLPRVQHRVG